MPRRGGVFDAPQPILHPIASHATFHDNTTAAAAAPPASTSPSASASVPQPSASEPQQQPQQQQPKQQQLHPSWKITRPDRPPPEQLSFSYLRSRKIEPYLPPPVDEQHTPPSLSHSLTHNFAPPAQHQYQQHEQQNQQQQPQHQHTAGQAHHQQQQLLQQQQQQQQASSPESPAPSAHEEEGDPHQQQHHSQDGHHHHHHRDAAAAAEGEEVDDDDEDEEDLDWKPRPFITLTYAQSLDSAIATAPGARTALSGPATKSMTHFLRSRHDAILVGVGTAVADDPGLNCRLEVEMGGGHQPRPVVLDPRGRWDVTAESKVVQLAREGRGLGPWVLVAEGVVPSTQRAAVLEEVGGRYIAVEGAGKVGVGGDAAQEEEGDAKGKKVVEGKKVDGDGEIEERDGDDDDASRPVVLTWDNIFGVLWEEGINSVMVEGGATVINDLLLLANEGLDVVDSVIVTVAPVWLGAGAVTVAPERPVDAHMRRVPGPRLTDVLWTQMGDDMVLCGRIMR